MDYDKIKLATGILAHAKRVYPDAFIAGGYVRDLYFNKEPKDLDIFTFMNPVQTAELRGDMAEDEAYQKDSRINYISCFSEFKIPVDIIHLQEGTVDGAISNFALGIQQVMLVKLPSVKLPSIDIAGSFTADAEWKIKGTAAWLRDVENKTLTICRCSSYPEAASIGHKIESLRSKYPWPVVIPPEFEWATSLLFAGNPL